MVNDKKKSSPNLSPKLSGVEMFYQAPKETQEKVLDMIAKAIIGLRDQHQQVSQQDQGLVVEKIDAGDHQYVLVEGEKKPLAFGTKTPPEKAKDVSTGDLIANMSGLEPELFDAPQKPKAESSTKG